MSSEISLPNNSASEKSQPSDSISPANYAGPSASNVRENMVRIALDFLKSPAVEHSTPQLQRQFLSSKGLSNQEIDAAFYEAGIKDQVLPYVPSSQPYAPASFVSHPSPPPFQVVPYTGLFSTFSIWRTLNNLCNMALLLAVAYHGGHYLYYQYLRPWLTGVPRKESLEKQLLEMQTQIAESMASLQGQVQAITETVSMQKAALQEVCKSRESAEGHSYGANHAESMKKEIASVRDELAMLKTLLVSRRNFTSTPSVAPAIPKWQCSNAQGLSKQSAEQSVATPLLASYSDTSPLTSSSVTTCTSSSNPVTVTSSVPSSNAVASEIEKQSGLEADSKSALEKSSNSFSEKSDSKEIESNDSNELLVDNTQEQNVFGDGHKVSESTA